MFDRWKKVGRIKIGQEGDDLGGFSQCQRPGGVACRSVLEDWDKSTLPASQVSILIHLMEDIYEEDLPGSTSRTTRVLARPC